MNTIHDVPVILRREIEALMIKPFLDAFEKEIGHERTYEIAAQVIGEIAGKQGAEYAEMLGGNDLKTLLKTYESWSSNDALETENIVESPYCFRQNIRKCAYVDMYERIGMRDLGDTLSCTRDEFFFRGFNPKMKFTRSKTLMNSDDCCDFCFNFPKED